MDSPKVLDLKKKKLSGLSVIGLINKESASARVIRTLNLSGNKLNDDDMKPLEEAMRKARVNHVDLTKNKLTSRGLTDLAQSLKGNLTLKSVSLDSSRATKHIVEAIDTLMTQNRELENCEAGNGEEVKLGGRGLLRFPEKLFKASQLRRLDFSNNGLKSIPFEIVGLVNLEILVLADNLLKNIPLYLCQLSHLVKLRLQNNQIKKLPGELCMLPALEDIDIRNNKLHRVPVPLARKLKFIKISGNRLKLPAELQTDEQVENVLDFLQQLTEETTNSSESTLSERGTSELENSDATESSDPLSGGMATPRCMSPRSISKVLIKDKMYLFDVLLSEVKGGKEDSLLDPIIVVLCYSDIFHLAVHKLLALEMMAVSSSPELMFRADSFITRLVVRYMAILGGPYLNALIGPVVELIKAEDVELEVAPAKVEDKKQLKKNQERLLFLANVFLNSVFLAKRVPYGICKIMREVEECAREHCPDSVSVCLGNFFFLRFLCPQIVTVECKIKAKRTIVLITKLLQNLANGSHFTKESGMDYFDQFIESNMERLQTFYKEVTQLEGRNRSATPLNDNSSSTPATPREASFEAKRKLSSSWSSSSARELLAISAAGSQSDKISSSSSGSPSTPRTPRKRSYAGEATQRPPPVLRTIGGDSVREADQFQRSLEELRQSVKLAKKVGAALSPRPTTKRKSSMSTPEEVVKKQQLREDALVKQAKCIRILLLKCLRDHNQEETS